MPAQRECVLSVTHWLQPLVSIPTETLMKNSQANDMWKSLLVVCDSWLPVNLNDFTKWRKKTATERRLRYFVCKLKVQYIYGMTPGHKFSIKCYKKELKFYRKWKNNNAEVMTKMH